MCLNGPVIGACHWGGNPSCQTEVDAYYGNTVGGSGGPPDTMGGMENEMMNEPW